MGRKRWLAGSAAVVLIGAAIWFWPRERPHLLLITLDTTRADRLGSYGYDAGQTPVLDALAKSGVLCERAYTVAPITLPAHASLFTGLYPEESGVRRNGHGRLDDSIPALAEILQQHGYDTAAFVASFVLHRKFGLNRGFQVYDDDFWRAGPPVEPDQRRRNGKAVVDAALQWLGATTSRPFFCWVHLYDPHAPCSSHPEMFADEFADRPYDGEIAYTDRQVGRLLDDLKARGLLEKTLVVVVGDHGESLGEHHELSHTLTLYNATMHVPLIFSQPGKLPPEQRVASNVSIVDVFPTILDLLGQSSPTRISGVTLRKALAGEAMTGSVCYGATDDPLQVFGCSRLRSLTDGNWKYIRTTRVELFDLANDPQELKNLSEIDPARTEEMEAKMVDFESRLVAREEVRVSLSASERKALESLGYAGRSATPSAETDANRPDIKDILPFENDLEDSKRLFKDGKVDAAITRLRDVIRQAPTHAPASWSLAWALWKQMKADEAMEVFRVLLTAWPDCHVAHYGLGFMYLQLDQLQEAIAEFQKAIESEPEDADAQLHLAESLFCIGRVDAAQVHLNLALQSDPGHFEANQLRAYMAGSFGRPDAQARYREALRQAARAAKEADFQELRHSHK